MSACEIRLLRPAGLVLALLGLLLPAPASAGPSDVRVRNAREVRNVEFHPQLTASRANAKLRRRSGRLGFEADGRRFEIDLDENLELLEDLPESQRRSLRLHHEVYRGSLADRPGSWVRLTRSGGGWKGLLFDGEELLAIEPSVGLAEDAPATELAMMRTRDVEMTGSCALEPAEMAEAHGPGTFGGFGPIPAAMAAAGSELPISLVGDESFVAENADPEGAALAVMNAVDGIYASQVGVSLRVVDLYMFDTSMGLDSNNAGTLLNQLQDLTYEGPVENPGLLHLLTGRNLDGSTIGIAYMGVLCHPNYGIGLSQFNENNLTATAILVAHEIGHNFGAPHDNEGGSVCGDMPAGFIMNPWLNSGADEFSSCSVERMNPEIADAWCLEQVAGDPTPACSNGIDDDGDGFIDYGGDIGCTDPTDPSEVHECQDGMDNDLDGLIDYPADPECLDADQWSELDPSCGLGFEVALILPLLSRIRRRRRCS